jgi:ribosomal protein S18 acetylase RimI-like enzyme
VTRFVSEALGAQDRSTFTSGYVLLEKSTGRVAGFYTLSSHSIALTDIAPELARKMPRYPSVPAVLIGWLGRDLAFRGQAIGSLLLYDAIARLATAPVGIHAICADAIDEAAGAFYQAHQFQPFLSRPQSLYLPMKTALALVGSAAGPLSTPP